MITIVHACFVQSSGMFLQESQQDSYCYISGEWTQVNKELIETVRQLLEGNPSENYGMGSFVSFTSTPVILGYIENNGDVK